MSAVSSAYAGRVCPALKRLFGLGAPDFDESSGRPTLAECL